MRAWPRKRLSLLSIEFCSAQDVSGPSVILYCNVNCGWCSPYCDQTVPKHMIARFYYKTMEPIVDIVLAISSLNLPGYVLLWIIDYLPEVVNGWTELEKIRAIDGVVKSARRIKNLKYECK
jgi:hypothetical protein